MRISTERIEMVSSATGFRNDVTEKVIRLIHLLPALNSHPILKGTIVLKGGTALNLFLFDLPRLSVDIDLNYIGAPDRKTYIVERPNIEKAMLAVFSREGLHVRKMPSEHAGGKWRLGYQTATGGSGSLEVDINYMFRIPLWDVNISESKEIGGYKASNIPILNVHELAAGKLAALFARKQARDLFDVYNLLIHLNMNHYKLRVAFLVYGALNRKDWRTISLDDIVFDPVELGSMLIPTLNRQILEQIDDPGVYAQSLIDGCREHLNVVFPFTEAEGEFLDGVLVRGEIPAELLTGDEILQDKIRRNPMLLWKVQNVRKH